MLLWCSGRIRVQNMCINEVCEVQCKTNQKVGIGSASFHATLPSVTICAVVTMKS